VTAAAEAKACCAAAYASSAARFLLGDTFHPGGSALTRELARALGVGPGQLVVDIASGPGTSALLLAGSTGCDVVGLDLAVGSAAAAAARAREAGQGGAVRFLCADAEALPLAGASVSGVLCECAFCLFPDKARAAKEIARVLRPGGRLVLSDVTAEPALLPGELHTLDAHVACVADARPLDETAALLGTAGLTVEVIARRDDAIVEILDRIDGRLRLARLVGGGPLGDLVDRAVALLGAARAAVADGALGYGVIVARR
jgi:SAM-dependent methyltransferase